MRSHQRVIITGFCRHAPGCPHFLGITAGGATNRRAGYHRQVMHKAGIGAAGHFASGKSTVFTKCSFIMLFYHDFFLHRGCGRGTQMTAPVTIFAQIAGVMHRVIHSPQKSRNAPALSQAGNVQSRGLCRSRSLAMTSAQERPASCSSTVR